MDTDGSFVAWHRDSRRRQGKKVAPSQQRRFTDAEAGIRTAFGGGVLGRQQRRARRCARCGQPRCASNGTAATESGRRLGGRPRGQVPHAPGPLREGTSASVAATGPIAADRARTTCARTRLDVVSGIAGAARAPTPAGPASPHRASSRSVSASRAWFRSIFHRHQSLFAFGRTWCTGQPCQKQPSTYTARRTRVKAISMVRRLLPGTLNWTLKRRPRR